MPTMRKRPSLAYPTRGVPVQGAGNLTPVTADEPGQNGLEVLLDFTERCRGIEWLVHPRLQVRLG